MSPTSGARWEKRLCAAGGGCSGAAFTAAVEKSKDQRKPEAFFGHRKAARRDNPEVAGSSPASATIRKASLSQGSEASFCSFCCFFGTYL